MDIWAYVILVLMGFAVFVMVDNRIQQRRKAQLHNKLFAPDVLRQSVSVQGVYHVWLSDGRRFESVQFLGVADDEADKLLFGYETMLVLRLADGKRVWVRQASVRCIMEV